MLRSRAGEQGADTSFWYLLDGDDDVMEITFGSLDSDARSVASRLAQVGGPGDRVVILMAPGPDFLAAFFGCLYAGMIAVPAFLPDMVNIKRSVPRLQAIAQDAEAVAILTDDLFVAFRDELWAVAPDLARTPWILVGDATSSGGDDWADPGSTQDTTAFIQYTSGSTSLPKGVVLSHGNLLANLELIRASSGGDDPFIGVSWLPPYHDMGLIGGILEPLYRGGQGALMSPLDFLSRPLRWLRAISTYSATTSPAPNFAFELCVRRIAAEDREGLDLSSWKYAFNGAEPVRASTIRRFAEAFEPHGYSQRTMLPCYGLAESTLYVSAKPTGELPLISRFDRDELAAGRAVSALVEEPSEEPSEEARSVELVSCGVGGPLHDIRIVDPDSSAPLEDDRLGEIWLAGPSVGHGYWGRRRQTAEVFHATTSDGEGPFLRTGDLGFFHDGQLYVAGRIKDILIVRGRNLYPQDLELVAESVPGVRAGCVAAFAVADVDGSTEGVAIVAEVNESTIGDLDAAARAVQAAVVEHYQVAPSEVVFIAPRSLPKTSSGKIQRHAAKRMFEEGSLELVGVPGS
ncbi:MAG: fatty acyl-AMP ligase [Actinobacteria bacterium]|nr:fatty acyl-AMP ligase [Actinomycetota bacterium]